MEGERGAAGGHHAVVSCDETDSSDDDADSPTTPPVAGLQEVWMTGAQDSREHPLGSTAAGPDVGGVADIESRHLQLLVTLDDHGRLSTAAADLGLKESVAKAQLSRIEASLGPIFHEGPAGITPTANGHHILARARQLLGSLSAFETDLRQLRDTRGPLVVWAAAIVPFEKWLPELRKRLPTWEWSVRAVSADDGLANLSRGHGDLFFGFRRVDDPQRVRPLPRGFEVSEVLHEAGWVRLGRSHPAAAQDLVNLADLADQVWAVLPDPDLEDGLVSSCRRAGFEPDIRFRPTEPGMKDQLAAAGEAVSLISPLAGEDDTVVMRPCVGGPVYAWALAYRSGALPPELIATIGEVIREDYRRNAAAIPALREALGPDGPTAP
jgi:DNA-binding transcriptional LysR family regulator